MLPVDLFLAFRYLRPRRTFVSFITLLSFLGPALGVAVLIIVNAVMSGFQTTIKERLMDWQAHLQVYPLRRAAFSEDDVKNYLAIMRENGVRCAPLIQDSVLVQASAGNRQFCEGKIAYGINPEDEREITPILNDSFIGKFDIREGEAIVGWRVARELGLKLGSQILLHSPRRLTKNVRFDAGGNIDLSQMDEVYLPERVTIVGIFDVGVSDIDANVLYIHIDQAADLFGFEWRSATSLQGKVAEPMAMTGLVNTLEKRLCANGTAIIQTWQERNASLFETLRVERTLLLFLMTFILIIASFSIAAILITVVVKKTREIGVLKATGISSLTIARIFILQGIIIGVVGSAIGTVLGVLIVIYRAQVSAFISFIVRHDVFPAELYHLSELPADLNVSEIVGFNVLAIVICILSALIPSLFAAAMRPAKSLQEV